MQQPQVLGGQVQISRSGRYFLQVDAGAAILRDLETGTNWNVPVRLVGGGRVLTSDGRVLGLAASEDRRLAVWSPTRVETLAELSSIPTEAAISDDGRTVVYRTSDGTLTRIDNRQQTVKDVLGVGSDVTLSNDGSLAVFRRDGECFLARRGRSEIERLLPMGTQAVACTLAGFGTAVVALTQTGQVLKLDLTTPGAVTDSSHSLRVRGRRALPGRSAHLARTGTGPASAKWKTSAPHPRYSRRSLVPNAFRR